MQEDIENLSLAELKKLAKEIKKRRIGRSDKRNFTKRK